MNAKTLLLIALISIAFGCRTKNKVITNYEEKKQESEKVKIDSLSSQSQQSVQNSSSETLSNDRKNEQIKVNGLQGGAWIVIAIATGILILAFFTYKYFKK